jgi:molybdopterin converting factor small subunit
MNDLRFFASLNNSCKMACGPAGKMKVRVQFYAQLRDVVGVRELDVELVEGATIRDLLEKIYEQRPALRPHDKSILIGAGLEFVGHNYKLNPGEEIAMMPPVQGG